MAVFNPDVPNPADPSYLGLSRPIYEYSGDRSMEVLFKGIGNVVDAGLKATDFLVKEDIESKVTQAVDYERDTFNSALQYAQTASGHSTDAVSGRPLNLIDDAPTKLPSDLENLGGYLKNLKASKDANKISQTHYTANLNSWAKAMRAQYPGYRDYIDAQFQKVSGMNPANAELSARISDLNTTMSGAKSEREQIEREILKNMELPLAPVVYEGWKNKKVSDSDVLMWIHRHKMEEHDLKMRAARRNDATGDRETKRLEAEDDADTVARNEATNYFEAITLSAGIKSGKDIADIVEKIRTGQADIPTEQILQLGQLAQQYRDTAFQSAWKKYNTPAKDGTTLTQRLGGPDKARERINGHLVLFDQVSKALSEKNIPLAGMAIEMAKAKKADAQLGMLKDKDMGTFFAMSGAMQDLGGPQFTQEFFKQSLARDLQPKVKEFVQYNVMKGITQHADARHGPGPYVMRHAVEDSEVSGIRSDKVGKQPTAKAYDEYVQAVELIGKPNTPDPIKLNAMVFAFDPENRGLISKFATDSKDDQGRVIPGKFSIFERMTSPAITEEVFRLGREKPEVINNYVNWAKQTFGVELFRGEVRDLQNIQFAPNAALQWDSEKHQFKVNPVGDNSFPGDFTRTVKGNFQGMLHNNKTYQTIEQTVERLNTGLKSISNIAKHTGEDVNQYMLQFLIRELGFDPSKGTPVNFGDHATKAIVNSILADKVKKAPPKKNK